MSYKRKRNPTGPQISVANALITKRGKRIHYRDPRTGAGLCGAGLPNKQFPFGSALDIYKPQGKVTLSCYRCIKILMMNRKMGEGPQLGKDSTPPKPPPRKKAAKQAAKTKRKPKRQIVKRENPVPVRTFSPTMKDREVRDRRTGKERLVSHRDEHVMVLGGRDGPHGSRKKPADYDFEDSPWEPGPPVARTQPRRWGKKKPPARERRFRKKVMEDEEFEDAKWNKYKRLKQKIKQRRRAMEDAPAERAELEAYYADAKKKMRRNPRTFDALSKFDELQGISDAEFFRKIKR